MERATEPGVLDLPLETTSSCSLLGLVADTYLRKASANTSNYLELPACVRVRLLNYKDVSPKTCIMLIELISHDVAWLARHNCEVQFVH